MVWTNYKTITVNGDGPQSLYEEWALKIPAATRVNDNIYTYQSTNLFDGSTVMDYFYVSTTRQYAQSQWSSTVGDGAGLSTGQLFMDTGSTTTHNGTYLCWESDEYAGSLLITKGKRVAFFHPGVDIYRYGDPVWPSGAVRSQTVLGPYLGGGAWFGWFSPHYPGSTTNYEITNGWTRVSLQTDTFLQGIPMYATLNSNSDVYLGLIEQPDMLLHLPAPIVASDDGWTSASGFIMKSGANYYLRTSSALGNPSYCFDLGTTEPTEF